MKNVKIDDKTYQVLQNEFTQCQTAYSTLHILDKVGEYDNLISLISNISNKLNCKSAIFGSGTILQPPMGIKLILSAPPAIIQSDKPALIFAEAIAILSKPEEQ